MSQEGQSSFVPETDIWYTHESIIRQLYLEEKKTLKEVKEIMELEHGFPPFTLSTYEIKLRDQLQLTKKLKKKDWPIVYRHYQQRKADGKQTDMYLNGVFIPWKTKAWKEIRRSGAPLDSIGAIQTPLPRGVILRTPPPVPASTCDNVSQLRLMSPRSQNAQVVLNNEGISSEYSGFYEQFSLMCLEDIPWLNLRKTLLEKIEPTIQAHTTALHRQIPRRGIEQIPFEYSNMLNSSALIPSVPVFGELSTQSDPFHMLARAVYIISNNHIATDDHFHELFDLLFARIPHRLVSDLFDSNLLSIQATWDIFSQNLHLIDRQDIFVALMKLGLSRPARIIRHGHVYLSRAVSIGCVDVVRKLLQLGVRADEELPKWNPGWAYGDLPAIYAAAASQNTKCLELLVKSCDLNRPILNRDNGNYSSFSLVLLSMADCFRNYVNWHMDMHPPSLKILLDHGANVDLPCPNYQDSQETMRLFFKDNEIPYTMPSLLEHCYYWNKQMYHQLVPFSSRPARNIYRDEVCLMAAMGHSSLLDYLTSKPCVDPICLESILAEQFFIGDKLFDSAVVRVLLELGVTINTSTPEQCFTSLLCLITRKARNLGFDENDVFIMKCLLSSGALLNSKVLAVAVAKEGTQTLELVSALGANFRQEGVRALCKAARLNNFVAVSWLLHREVHINAAITEPHIKLGFVDTMSVAVASVMSFPSKLDASPCEDVVWEWGGPADCNMLEYLFDNGAKLWLGSPNASSLAALRVILQTSHRDLYLLDMVRLILDRDTHAKELPRSGFHLLEASLTGIIEWSETSDRSKVFKLLWQHGAPAHPGGVVAGLIICKAPRQLVLDLINSGADITAHTTTARYFGWWDSIQAASLWWNRGLVSALLERGANINSRAFEDSGNTVLQAACWMNGASEAENRTQIEFVQFLLDNNADVNAPAATDHGYTALQLATFAGNLDLLALLISHGALVNMPNHYYGKCALDFAAQMGRLDATHFLLKAGALSYCHGQSGYEGAIRIARTERFFVLVECLQEHVRNNEILFLEQPILAAAHNASMADRDWTDDMFIEEIW